MRLKRWSKLRHNAAVSGSGAAARVAVVPAGKDRASAGAENERVVDKGVAEGQDELAATALESSGAAEAQGAIQNCYGRSQARACAGKLLDTEVVEVDCGIPYCDA